MEYINRLLHRSPANSSTSSSSPVFEIGNDTTNNTFSKAAAEHEVKVRFAREFADADLVTHSKPESFSSESSYYSIGSTQSTKTSGINSDIDDLTNSPLYKVSDTSYVDNNIPGVNELIRAYADIQLDSNAEEVSSSNSIYESPNDTLIQTFNSAIDDTDIFIDEKSPNKCHLNETCTIENGSATPLNIITHSLINSSQTQEELLEHLTCNNTSQESLHLQTNISVTKEDIAGNVQENKQELKEYEAESVKLTLETSTPRSTTPVDYNNVEREKVEHICNDTNDKETDTCNKVNKEADLSNTDKSEIDTNNTCIDQIVTNIVIENIKSDNTDESKADKNNIDENDIDVKNNINEHEIDTTINIDENGIDTTINVAEHEIDTTINIDENEIDTTINIHEHKIDTTINIKEDKTDTTFDIKENKINTTDTRFDIKENKINTTDTAFDIKENKINTTDTTFDIKENKIDTTDNIYGQKIDTEFNINENKCDATFNVNENKINTSNVNENKINTSYVNENNIDASNINENETELNDLNKNKTDTNNIDKNKISRENLIEKKTDEDDVDSKIKSTTKNEILDETLTLTDEIFLSSDPLNEVEHIEFDYEEFKPQRQSTTLTNNDDGVCCSLEKLELAAGEITDDILKSPLELEDGISNPVLEIFHDPTTFDFLSARGNSESSTRLRNESLFIKFDPLLANTSMLPQGNSQVFSTPTSGTIHKLEEIQDKNDEPLQVTKSDTKEVENTDGTEKLELLRVTVSQLEKELEKQKTEYESKLEKQKAASQEKIAKLQAQLNEEVENKNQLAVVVDEYEKSISRLLTEKERDHASLEQEKSRIQEELQATNLHLSNTEAAFNDVHLKYERLKGVVSAYKNNEGVLKESIQENLDTIKSLENRYDQLKTHAMSQLRKANLELVDIRKQHESETVKLHAMVRKAELKSNSLAEIVEQKTKENKELTQILDELIARVGRQNAE
ncbi:PREDICTED: uncharacterized protein PFB0145c isoform X2 [Polistes canadensis]|uniref:uncharacterized protein PFB0145c isoform X2 n=1 Tax=Polistes canadensis TaxID=91411 RepID=UPI000718D9C1|nr:PREDICTED: uncharacterized protein PFB0145c isoform X2 [Polistes canadensis]